MKEYLKDKINELATNSKNENIGNLYRGVNKFKSVTGNFLKGENFDLLADDDNILGRLWNVHSVSDVVTHIPIHTAETLVPNPILFEVEVAVAKLKNYSSPGSDQFPAELIQAVGETLVS
jgi:hypothetical protein